MPSISLESMSSLPLELDVKGNRLILGGDLVSQHPKARTLEEMKDVLYEPSAEGPSELYFMYRDLHLKEHESVFRENSLRFDATLILSGLVGREFVKTAGHYHPTIPGLGISYPEIYEVIYGGAVYLLQKIWTLADPRRVTDVVAIEAVPGDKVIIPPNYGHITINPYKTPLVMTNVTADGFNSIYDPYRGLRGGAAYLVSDKRHATWISNPHYLNPPDVRQIKARELREFGLSRTRPLYRTLVDDPGAFEFLKNPLHYVEALNLTIQ